MDCSSYFQYNVVLKWEQPRGEMVAYRSFSPFVPLLRSRDMPAVQLWAVWAILHVCTKNGIPSSFLFYVCVVIETLNFLIIF